MQYNTGRERDHGKGHMTSTPDRAWVTAVLTNFPYSLVTVTLFRGSTTEMGSHISIFVPFETGFLSAVWVRF